MRASLLAVILILAGASGASARAEDKTVKAADLPLPGLFRGEDDAALMKHAPKEGVIAGPKAWAKLWKDWRGEKAAPKVDFTKELVLVALCSGPNIINVEPLKVDDKGDLKFQYNFTERGGPGFSAKLLKVSREGVKTVNGKALPKE